MWIQRDPKFFQCPNLTEYQRARAELEPVDPNCISGHYDSLFEYIDREYCKRLTRRTSATSQAKRLRGACRGTAEQSPQGCVLAKIVLVHLESCTSAV